MGDGRFKTSDISWRVYLKVNPLRNLLKRDYHLFLNHYFESLKIYNDVKIKSEVIQKIGYEIDEVLSKIDTLETNRKSKFIWFFISNIFVNWFYV